MPRISPLGAAIGALLLANAALFWQNYELKQPRTPSEPFRPAAGQMFRTLNALAGDGRIVRVPFGTGESPALVLTMSSGCPFCQKNEEAWRTLATAAGRAGYR